MTTTYTRSFSSLRVLLIGFVLLAAFVPFLASAASSKPSCELTLTTSRGEVSLRNEKKVLLPEKEPVTISWTSKNAKSAENRSGDSIATTSSETFTPTRTTKYSYKFESGRSKTTCSFTAYVTTATIDAKSLSDTSSKPTITGTASKAKSVQIALYKDGKSVYKGKTVAVKRGEWSVTIPKALAKGTYEVRVYGPRDVADVILTSGILGVGVPTLGMVVPPAAPTTGSTTIQKSNTTLSVALIPLLSGGSTRANTTVPVSYLQIKNTGKEAATVTGFWVKQNGTASGQAIAALTTVDDKGGSRGESVAAPFKSGMAFAPTNAELAPGQMRLFTIKAVLGASASAYAGQNLKLDVTGIAANTINAKGAFPIRGTTWTITN